MRGQSPACMANLGLYCSSDSKTHALGGAGISFNATFTCRPDFKYTRVMHYRIGLV